MVGSFITQKFKNISINGSKTTRYLMLITGILIYACSYNLFILNNEIVAGGVSGIGTILKDILDPSVSIFLASIFLLILSFILLGKEKTTASIVGSLLFPLFVKLTSDIGTIIPIENTDLFLIAVFGGFCQGIASGLVFKAGFTTGGTDILNQIASKYGKISIGTAMLFTDGLIVLAGGFFFGWTKVMYAIIVLYIISLMADRVILGISSNKAFYIVTDKEKEVKEYILKKLGRGVTILDGRGGYTDEKQKVFMCVIPTREYFKVKEEIEKLDDNAFFIVTDAYHSYGGS